MENETAPIKSKSYLPLIAGAAGGALVLLLVIICICVCIRRRRNADRDGSYESDFVRLA